MALTWDRTLYDEMYVLHGYKTRWGIPSTLAQVGLAPEGDKTPYPKFKVHYHRGPMFNATVTLIKDLLALPGVPNITKALVIGGGFGWSVEALEANGIEAFHTEIGDHILNTQGTTEEQEFLDALAAQGLDTTYRMWAEDGTLTLDPLIRWGARNVRNKKQAVEEDIASKGSRNKVKNKFTGNSMDIIITELVLESMDDNELANFLSDVEALRPNPTVLVLHVIVPNHPDVRFNQKSLQEWHDFIVGLGLNHLVLDVSTFEVL